MIGMNKLLASIAFTTVCVLSSGCGRNGFAGKADFDMPPSLIDRMRVSYNCDRARRTGSAETLDGEEMMALMQLGYDKAYEIAARPRGDMVFADDGRNEEERRKLWPFDVESFEATLEKSLGIDEHGLICLKDEEGDLFPFNPSMRAVNEKMEQWAIRQLDASFTRVKSAVYAKMKGEPVKEGEAVMMWAIPGDGGEYFAIERRDGAWNLRSYLYLLWDGEEQPTLFADFYSFPNREEAVAMRTSRKDCRSLHNMAVLYWRHRVFPMQFNPKEIKQMLEIARREGVSTAKANLAVLKAHIPEVDSAMPSDEIDAP